MDIGQWMGKLRLQVMSMVAGSKLSIGLVRKNEWEKANESFKDSIPCMYLDSTGKNKGMQYNHLGVIQANYSIDCFVKKNNFRMVCKNNNAIINLADKNYYFFFALEGNIKVKIVYPFNK